MSLRDRLLGGDLTSLNLEAKGYAYPQQGSGTGSWSYSLDGTGWLGLTRPSSQEYAAVKLECSSALAVCLNTVTGAFPEAELCVEREVEGEAERLDQHAALMLVEEPNPYFSGAEMLAVTVRDLMTHGNGYIVKRRGRGQTVVELWPISAAVMRPVWPTKGDTFIGAYEFSVDGERRYFDPGDVIHVRMDRDPNPPSYGRCGLSPLPPIMRDLYIDEASADFTSAIMKNMGVPGAIVSPRVLVEGRAVSWPKPDRDEFAADYQRRFTGQGRGRVMASGMPLDVQQLGFDPEKMSLREIRQIAEERIAAVYNIPPIVAGFGAGLEHSTYANYEHAIKAFWAGCIIPLQRRVATALTTHLLRVDWPQETDAYFEFEYDHIAALQESETEKRERDREDYLAGLLTHHQAVERLGIDPEGEDWMVLPSTVTAFPVGGMPEPEPMPEPLALNPAPDEEEPNPSKSSKSSKADDIDRGPIPHRTPQELEDEAQISDEDIERAQATMRERSPELADLLDAERTRKAAAPIEIKANFRWNPRTRRYYNAAGQMVSKARVDGAMDDAVEASRQVMAGYAEKLIAGDINQVDYYLAMRDEIKTMHLAGIATTRGGWDNLTPRERGQAARRIQTQYDYLYRSMLDFETGARDINGRVRASSMMYASSARTAYGEADYEAAKDAVEAQPATHQERWVRHASDSCSGCVSQASRSWVPLGDLPEIGTQTCLTNCKCSKIVRKKPRTG